MCLTRFKCFCFFVSIEIAAAVVTNVDQLACSFENEQCFWFNGTNGVEDTIDWHLAKAIPLALTSADNYAVVLQRSDIQDMSCMQSRDNKPSIHLSKLILSTTDCSHSSVLTIVGSMMNKQSDVYSFVRGYSANTSAWLVSDKIVLSSDVGLLTFHYWQNRASSTVRVCTRQPPGFPNAVHCFWQSQSRRQFNTKWSVGRVKLTHVHNEPFEIIIALETNDSNALVAIDDIAYSLDDHLAPSEADVAQQEERSEVETSVEAPEVERKSVALSELPSKSLRLVVDAEQCPQIACDFDVDLCGYKSIGKTSFWRQTTKSIGNSLMSIGGDVNGDGGFCYAASLQSANETFVLRSPPFVTDERSTLTLNLAAPGRKGKLQLCDSVKCATLYDADKEAADHSPSSAIWRTLETDIEAGTHQLYLIASGLPAYHVFAVDNIQIWNLDKSHEMICYA